MAEVALAVHSGLGPKFEKRNFICASSPEDDIYNLFSAGTAGRGLNDLSCAAGRVVHVHGIWTGFEWRAYHWAKRHRAKVVISPHGALEPWALGHKWVKKRIAWWGYQRSILQHADLIVVNSAQELNHLRKLGLGGRIAVIPNGVNPPTQANSEADRQEKVILFFSRIAPKKGIPDLLNAWRELRAKNGYILRICGFGETGYMREISSLIADMPNSADVELVPAAFGEEKWHVYNAASLYVLPSYSENFGITVVEAMISGLPVITTRATPWSELEVEKVGWVIDNDVEQLRMALQAAVQLDQRDLAQMGARARSYAKSRFMWPQVIEKYEETYAWISNPTSPSPSWVSV